MKRLVGVALFVSSMPALGATSVSQVEVVWKDEGVRKAHITFAMPLDKACSETDFSQSTTRFKLRACRNGGEDEAPLVDFVLEEADGEKSANVWNVRSTVRLARGKTVSLGAMQHAGPARELTALLR